MLVYCQKCKKDFTERYQGKMMSEIPNRCPEFACGGWIQIYRRGWLLSPEDEEFLRVQRITPK